MLEAATIEVLARRLYEAEQQRRPIQPLTQQYALTLEEAYRVQQARVALQAGTPIGYKLGFTSAAMRAQLGIDRPNYGVLLDRMLLTQPQLACSALIHPRIEPEIALYVGRTLEGKPDWLALQAAIEVVYPCLEIVDTRYQQYVFQLEDNTADNSSAARVWLGPPQRWPCRVDLALVGVRLWRNGQAIDQGLGAEAMGHPLLALQWLVETLTQQGQTLPAGSLVLTGGLTRAHPVQPGDTYVAEFGGLGTLFLSAV
ncbi:MAG: fumarylacetoacetate hydrolase family protein [Rhodothermus sp.]|nr:fumarylacetoacetate hydrolase family protein [Rhodothermus sp.]